MCLRDNHCKTVVDESWLDNPNPTHQKISDCLKNLAAWGNKRFGDIPRKRKKIEETLKALIPKSHEAGIKYKIKETENNLNDLLESEEVWWSQRSRAQWLQFGDKKMRFFHQKASQRKERNWIDSIQDKSDRTVNDETGIGQVLTNYFQSLFSNSNPDVTTIEEATSVIKDRISNDMKDMLGREFTKEVSSALNQMKPNAAPGSDGMPALFYQKFWDKVGADVVSMVLDILNGNIDPGFINQTFICLIPKVKKPKHPRDFRPISLCNMSFKIVTKTIANRLKLILSRIVGPFLSAFVPGRLITNNVLIAFETFHFMRKKQKAKNGYIGLKLDMAKAYDRIEWNFLENVLLTMGFPTNWVALVLKCVSSVSFSVLLNGRPLSYFSPQRGLRQGDPLSPYLFILCAEVFSGLILRAQERRSLHGIRIARNAPEISHLFRNP